MGGYAICMSITGLGRDGVYLDNGKPEVTNQMSADNHELITHVEFRISQRVLNLSNSSR